MNPLWDNLLVAAAITAAVTYMILTAFARKRNAGGGCGGNCGCPPRRGSGAEKKDNLQKQIYTND